MARLQEETTQSSSEDVNASQAKETQGTEEKESGKDYAQEARNKAIALKQERERLATVEAELNEYKAKEAKEIEKKKKDQGKYEELLQEKDNTILEMQKKLEDLNLIASKHQEVMQKQLDDLSKQIPDTEREFVQSLLTGKQHDEQVAILEKMSKSYGSYDPKAQSGDKTKTTYSKPSSVSEGLSAIVNRMKS